MTRCRVWDGEERGATNRHGKGVGAREGGTLPARRGKDEVALVSSTRTVPRTRHAPEEQRGTASATLGVVGTESDDLALRANTWRASFPPRPNAGVQRPGCRTLRGAGALQVEQNQGEPGSSRVRCNALLGGFSRTAMSLSVLGFGETPGVEHGNQGGGQKWAPSIEVPWLVGAEGTDGVKTRGCDEGA